LTPHATMPVGPSASRLAIQSDTLSLEPKHPETSQFTVIKRSSGIGYHASESYYRAYKGATTCVNRCASWICHIGRTRKTLEENLLHIISTEFSSSATHNTGLMSRNSYRQYQLFDLLLAYPSFTEMSKSQDIYLSVRQGKISQC
jgi:hypothetical protein